MTRQFPEIAMSESVEVSPVRWNPCVPESIRYLYSAIMIGKNCTGPVLFLRSSDAHIKGHATIPLPYSFILLHVHGEMND